MSTFVIKIDEEEYRVDRERTEREYRDQLSSFIESDLFTCNPYSLSDEKIDTILERRSRAYVKSTWISSVGRFFSRCHLESVLNIQDKYPWVQLTFQPWNHFGCVTMNRFQRDMRVYLEKERIVLPIKIKNEVLGSRGDTTDVNYFKQNSGKPFIYCYGIRAVDNNSPYRLCLRFAEDSFKREALLLTGLFSVNYLLNHPIECFSGPYLPNSFVRCGSIGAMSYILNPIMEEAKPKLLEVKSRLEEEVKARHLQSEEI